MQYLCVDSVPNMIIHLWDAIIYVYCSDTIYIMSTGFLNGILKARFSCYNLNKSVVDRVKKSKYVCHRPPEHWYGLSAFWSLAIYLFVHKLNKIDASTSVITDFAALQQKWFDIIFKQQIFYCSAYIRAYKHIFTYIHAYIHRYIHICMHECPMTNRPLEPTAVWNSHLALAIYMFVVVDFDPRGSPEPNL